MTNLQFEPARPHCSIGRLCTVTTSQACVMVMVVVLCPNRVNVAAGWVVCCQLRIVRGIVASGHVTSQVVTGGARATNCFRTREYNVFAKRTTSMVSCHLSSPPNSCPRRHSIGTSVNITCLRDCQKRRVVSAAEGSHSRCPFGLVASSLSSGKRRIMKSAHGHCLFFFRANDIVDVKAQS